MAQWFIRIGRWSSWSGLRWFLPKQGVTLMASHSDRMNQNTLAQWLINTLNCSLTDWVIYAGSTDKRRKITLMALADGTKKPFVVKVADTNPAREAIIQESKALKRLADSPLCKQVPKTVLKETIWNDYLIQAQTLCVPGFSAQTFNLEPAHIDFLSQLSQLDRQWIPLNQTQLWQQLITIQEPVLNSEKTDPNSQKILKKLLKLDEKQPIPCHRGHGDFAPWNIRWHKHTLHVVDWEESLPNQPAFLDLFHFTFSCYLTLNWPGAASVMKQMAMGCIQLSKQSELNLDVTIPLFPLWLLIKHHLKPTPHTEDMMIYFNGLERSWLDV